MDKRGIKPSYGFTTSPQTVKEMMDCRRKDLSIVLSSRRAR
jgi:hypothetical protein